MSPPKKRPPATLARANGGDETNRISIGRVKQAEQNFKPELWPANVSRLHAFGITHEWRQEKHDLELACLCGGKLTLHESEPWHHCFGDRHCRARTMTFAQVVTALVEKGEVKS